MFWLMISGLILYALSISPLIFLVDRDSKKRHLYGYLSKIMFFGSILFGTTYLLRADAPCEAKQIFISSKRPTEVTELNYCPLVMKALKILYFVAIFSVLLIFFAVIFRDLS